MSVRAPTRHNPRPWPRCERCGHACYSRAARFCSYTCRYKAGACGRKPKWPWREIPVGGGFSIPKRWAGSYMDTSANALRQLAERQWECAKVIKCRHGVTVIRLAGVASNSGGRHAAHPHDQA